MGCDCGKPKCDGHCGVSPAVLQINNPSECVLFHRVEVPASMGDSKTNPPKSGAYKNVLLFYEADQTSWLYSSDGVPQKLVNGLTDYEDAINLPQINGATLIGDKNSADLKLADAPMVITIASGNTAWSGADTAEDIYNFFLNRGKVNVVFEGSDNYGYEIVSAAYIPGEQKMMCMTTVASLDTGSSPVEFTGSALYGLMTFYTVDKAVDVGELDLQPKLLITDFTGLSMIDGNVLEGVPATNASIGMVKPGDGLSVSSDGTLTVIDHVFDTVADMKQATNLVNGSYARTLSYANVGDGGGALYKITNTASTTEYQESLGGGLYATLVVDNEIRVSTFGAVGDGVTDDTDALQKAFDYAINNKTIVFERAKTYKVDCTRNSIARNGSYTIEKAYSALVLKGYNVTIIGNDATIKNTLTQAQYDSNASNVGSVIIISANSQDPADISQANSYDFDVQMGQNIKISNLTIDGGGENITRTYQTPSSDHLRQAKGISCAGQDLFKIELDNCKIIHTIYEGITGGGPNATVIIRGCYFEDCFPSGPNVSGRYELIEGCTFKNRVCIEVNPSYPLGTQIVRNNHFIATFDTTPTRQVCSAVGLLSTTPSDNCNVFIEDNIFDITFNVKPDRTIFSFKNLNNFTFRNNTLNITANDEFVGGYGNIMLIGNMNGMIYEYNKFRFDYGSGLKPNPIFNFDVGTTRGYTSFKGNINEVVNTLDFSGNNYNSNANNTTFPELTSKYTFSVPSGSTTLVYRLTRMNNYHGVLIKTNKYVELSNFNIQAFNSSNAFESITGGPKTMKFSPRGTKIEFDTINPASDQMLWITSSATAEDLTFEMEFYS